MLRRLVRANVRLVLRLDPGAGCIEADPFQLHQLLLNLAANARDAMPEGGELEISTSACAVTPAAPALDLPAGNYVRLSVRDTGEGMDAATRKRLFEPFFTTKAEGMGLGLNICRSIVEAHGGRLSTGTRATGGCEFRFTVHAAGDAS
jgi:signal transduction histidine kinase